MARKFWSKQECQFLRSLVENKKLSITEIANIGALGDRSRDAIDKQARRMKLKIAYNVNNFSSQPPLTRTTWEQDWSRFRELIGKVTPEPQKRIPDPKRDESIVNISDLHIPFHREDLLVKCVKTAKEQGCKIAVQGGDFIDCFAFSRFTKFKHINPEDEIKTADKVLQYLSSEFDEVIIIKGNHERRSYKYFAERVPSEFMFMVDWDIMENLAKGYSNARCHRQMLDGEPISFFYQRGDAIFGHAETSSKTEGKPVKNFLDWLLNWKDRLGLKPFKVVLENHIHQLSKFCTMNDITCFETGCLCETQGYAVDANIKYRPQRNGFVIIHQRDGITDINNSHYYQLGV